MMSGSVTRNIMLALPVLAVLLLARCASSDSDSDQASNVNPDQIRAIVAAMQAQPSGGSGNSSGNREYSAEQIKAAMRKHIARRTRMGNPGVFEITDPRTSQVLQLEFQKIHDPVRTLGGGLYFACTNFATLGEPDKTYDLDFWVQPLDGELMVYSENVHKLPVRKNNKWVQQPRYTFVNDKISLLR